MNIIEHKHDKTMLEEKMKGEKKKRERCGQEGTGYNLVLSAL